MVSFFGLLSNTLTPHPKYETQTGLMKKKKQRFLWRKLISLGEKEKIKKIAKCFVRSQTECLVLLYKLFIFVPFHFGKKKNQNQTI